MNIKSKNKVILLFGPTAVGKTDMLVRLFRGRGEVINADSMQVYRRMNIGTAKAPPSITDQIPHHLLDVKDPDQQFHAGEFVHRADELCEAIRSRGKVPVLSGGTAFYFRNFLFGLPETPQVPEAVRDALQEELRRLGAAALHSELAEVDPVSAARINKGDSYRITRALEVYRHTRRPLSDYEVPSEPRPGIDPLILGLYRERNELYKRIDDRVEILFRQGLAEEFRALLAMGYGEDAPGMQGIGYREFFLMEKNGCLTMAAVKALIQQNSRRYAKRQLTFFRSLPGVEWFLPEQEELILYRVNEFLGA